MSIEIPAVLASGADAAAETRSAASTARIETAVTVLFAAAAVLGVSFLAVIAGLA